MNILYLVEIKLFENISRNLWGINIQVQFEKSFVLKVPCQVSTDDCSI